jgi:hypothetical protein
MLLILSYVIKKNFVQTVINKHKIQKTKERSKTEEKEKEGEQ